MDTYCGKLEVEINQLKQYKTQSERLEKEVDQLKKYNQDKQEEFLESVEKFEDEISVLDRELERILEKSRE